MDDDDGAGLLHDARDSNFQPSSTARAPGVHQLWWETRAAFGLHPGDLQWGNDAPGDDDQFGHTDNTVFATENTWWLTKWHFALTDVGTPSIEMWMRPMGTLTWQKSAEWIDGATVEGGLVSINPTPHAETGEYGHSGMRLFTTVGRPVGYGEQDNVDSWIYIADFAIAAEENDLPQYRSY